MYEQENRWGYRKRLRFVRRAIEDHFRSHDSLTIRILDVGCGNGSQLSIPLARSGFDVTGIDPDESSIAHASRLAGNFAGPFAGQLLARSSRFIQWNAGVTDRLPMALASGWYFALRQVKASGAAE